MVSDPRHYLALIETKPGALDQAAALQGWVLQSSFAQIRRLLEARSGRAGKREFIQILRLTEIAPPEVIGLVIETQCNYFAPLAFPQTIEAGLRVAHLGSSSVRYEVGLFAQGEPLTAACGHFIHVYVDRQTRRPVPLPPSLKTVLQTAL